MTRQIKILGRAVRKVKPDTIVLDLTLQDVNKDYDKALSLVNNKHNNLRTDLESIGIKKEKIVTSDFSVRQKTKTIRKPDNTYEQEFEGYEVRHNLSLSVQFDTMLLGRVLNIFSNSLSYPQVNISFVKTNDDEDKKNVLEDAVKNAKDTAQILANASGVKLGNIINISYDRNFNIESSNRNVLFARADCCSDSQIEAKDLTYETSVEIEWEII